MLGDAGSTMIFGALAFQLGQVGQQRVYVFHLGHYGTKFGMIYDQRVSAPLPAFMRIFRIAQYDPRAVFRLHAAIYGQILQAQPIHVTWHQCYVILCVEHTPNYDTLLPVYKNRM